MWFLLAKDYLALNSSSKIDWSLHDLDLKVKVKFDITNPYLRYGFLSMFYSYVYLAQIRSYMLLKCNGTVFDMDFEVKVKYQRFLRC